MLKELDDLEKERKEMGDMEPLLATGVEAKESPVSRSHQR